MNRPLNVLLVSQPVSYGVAICVRDLTQAAVAAGHRVTVVSPDSTHGPLAGWIEATGAAHVPMNMARTPALRDVSDLMAIRRLSRGRDVVHLHSSKAGALGRVAAMSLGRRRRPAVVFTAHYWSWLVGGRWAALYRWIERVLARRCDAIVAVSEAEAEEGRAVLGARSPTGSIAIGSLRSATRPTGPKTSRSSSAWEG